MRTRTAWIYMKTLTREKPWVKKKKFTIMKIKEIRVL